jgi:hypothetical protein
MSTENQAQRNATAQDFTDCPFWGQGGSFVVDPATGKRMPVDEAAASGAEAQTNGGAPAKPAGAPAKLKDKTRG